jgi:hypothetical protein
MACRCCAFAFVMLLLYHALKPCILYIKKESCE